MTLDVKKQGDNSQGANKTPRQHWMGILSRAPIDELESRWKAMESRPETRFIRAPEIGLMMVRSRAGGSGTPFNLGEMTMTRCVVALENGTSGFGYVQGRSKRHAELAASFDALLQDSEQNHPAQHAQLLEGWLNPLHETWKAERAKRSKAAASTKVDFFTMVRGE